MAGPALALLSRSHTHRMCVWLRPAPMPAQPPLLRAPAWIGGSRQESRAGAEAEWEAAVLPLRGPMLGSVIPHASRSAMAFRTSSCMAGGWSLGGAGSVIEAVRVLCEELAKRASSPSVRQQLGEERLGEEASLGLAVSWGVGGWRRGVAGRGPLGAALRGAGAGGAGVQRAEKTAAGCTTREARPTCQPAGTKIGSSEYERALTMPVESCSGTYRLVWSAVRGLRAGAGGRRLSPLQVRRPGRGRRRVRADDDDERGHGSERAKADFKCGTSQDREGFFGAACDLAVAGGPRPILAVDPENGGGGKVDVRALVDDDFAAHTVDSCQRVWAGRTGEGGRWWVRARRQETITTGEGSVGARLAAGARRRLSWRVERVRGLLHGGLRGARAIWGGLRRHVVRGGCRRWGGIEPTGWQRQECWAEPRPCGVGYRGPGMLNRESPRLWPERPCWSVRLLPGLHFTQAATGTEAGATTASPDAVPRVVAPSASPPLRAPDGGPNKVRKDQEIAPRPWEREREPACSAHPDEKEDLFANHGLKQRDEDYEFEDENEEEGSVE
ncbi:hypothetical protein ACSSS7_002989 [Eimeria intestinalis]